MRSGFSFTIDPNGRFTYSYKESQEDPFYEAWKQKKKIYEQQRKAFPNLDDLPLDQRLKALRELLNKVPNTFNKPVSKEDRIKQINHELDICKGRVPTPKGYSIDKDKIKSLVRDLNELTS